jgi:hypothetical protein
MPITWDGHDRKIARVLVPTLFPANSRRLQLREAVQQDWILSEEATREGAHFACRREQFAEGLAAMKIHDLAHSVRRFACLLDSDALELQIKFARLGRDVASVNFVAGPGQRHPGKACREQVGQRGAIRSIMPKVMSRPLRRAFML